MSLKLNSWELKYRILNQNYKEFPDSAIFYLLQIKVHYTAFSIATTYPVTTCMWSDQQYLQWYMAKSI